MPSPAPLMALSTAYWDSQVFLTANRIGVFGLLSEAPLTAADIADRLHTGLRATTLMLNACVALGLLECDEDRRFANSALSAAYLVPGQPGFMGNAVSYSDNLYGTWGELEQALRDERPPMAPETYLGDDPKQTRDFVYGMHDRALGIGRAMVGLVDLGGRKALLDVGGGPGTYSALLTARFPGLNSRVMDLPHVVALAGDIVESMGAGERVSTVAGSYLSDAFPAGNDVVLISGVFHRESEATCRELIARAAASLDAGGMLIVADVFADAGGQSPAFATLFGLNMLLTATDGTVHADADVEGWMRDAGFATTGVKAFPPPMPHRLVSGVLPERGHDNRESTDRCTGAGPGYGRYTRPG